VAARYAPLPIRSHQVDRLVQGRAARPACGRGASLIP
jgi:hypothetical protein